MAWALFLLPATHKQSMSWALPGPWGKQRGGGDSTQAPAPPSVCCVFEIIHHWNCMCVLNCLLLNGSWMCIPPLKNWLASSGLSASHAWHCTLLFYPPVRAYFSSLRYGFRIPFGHMHKELPPNRQNGPCNGSQWTCFCNPFCLLSLLMTFTLDLFHIGQLILKVFLNLLLCVYDMLFVCWGAHAAMYVRRAKGGSQLILFVWVLRPKLRPSGFTCWALSPALI